MTEALSRLLVPGTDRDVADTYAALAERAQEAVFGFEEEMVFVDIETTGFDADRDEMIEIGAVLARGPEVLDRFHTMVDPGRPVPLEIGKLTGIDDSMLTGAPGPEAAARAFAEFAAGRDMAAHNVAFDRSFLTRAAGGHSFAGAWLDSLQLSLIALPRLRSHRLADLASAFGAVTPTHRAGDDADALAFVWRVLLCGVDAMPSALVRRISNLAPGTDWPLRQVFAHMAASGREVGFDLVEVRRERASIDKGESMSDAHDLEECGCPDPEALIDEFGPDGLAGRMYPGFEHRSEQARMAEAVLEAFATGTHLAVEAGTGVGKSLAYLVPIARYAQLNGIGVGVATKTNSLMDQLVHSELPALCRALDENLRYVALKGYEHYPCLRKLDRLVATLDDESPEALVTVASLLAWIAQSSWGDLDAINVHWRPAIRGQAAASVADCTYKRCRYYPHLCYLHGVRRRASSAHVVVTNHALLFRDVVADGGILPPIRHWVVDEAHSVEDEARKQLTLQASHAELASLLAALHAPGKSGLFDGVRRALRSAGSPDVQGVVLAGLAQAEEHVTTTLTLTASLFDFVKDLHRTIGESAYDACQARIDPGLRETGAWGTVASVGGSLARKLEEVIAAGRQLVTQLEEAGPDFNDLKADLGGILVQLAEQRLGLVTVLDGEASDYVYYAALDRRPTVIAERLVAARLDIGQVLAEEFYPRTSSVVFTSATVATGESFSHFARSTGLDLLGEEAWRSLRLESSYDFDRQMAVFVPRDLPLPGTPEYMTALGALLFDVHVAMGGSTLTLFTNRREMEALYRELEPRLDAEGIPLLVQGRGVSNKRLRDEFVADERLSLFATKSFWEGFDAKGDTLRCVVVAKLPFGRPTDPLAAEREAREGRVAWKRYTLPQAIIELKQAAGRLIRSSTDEGCLVITDVRLLQRGYGRDFLCALPVADVEVLESTEAVGEIGRRFGVGARDGADGIADIGG